MPTAWYFKNGDQVFGPMPSQELKEKATWSIVKPETWVTP